MDDSIELIDLFSANSVATSRDSNGYAMYVTASWVPYHIQRYTLSHWVIRPFPPCVVKVLHPAQLI